MLKIKIGLEIHCQLNTKSKLFSFGKNTQGEPNEFVDFLDVGIPGTLPLINIQAIESAVIACKALNCVVDLNSDFDRKHYNYPDLPLGYQITQYYNPIGKNGYIDIGTKKINIERIHMETDAGKTTEQGLDFNRCGVPLIEIVTGPDFQNKEEVNIFLKELLLFLRHIKVCDCNLEKGNLRVDVNISVSKNEISTHRVEVKNVNSFKFIDKVIDYEVERQEKILDQGLMNVQETRGWNEKETYSMRTKENFYDYRYIHDFNIPPIKLTQKYVDSLQFITHLQRKNIYEKIGLHKEQIITIIADITYSEFFDKIIEKSNNLIILQCAKIFTNEFLSLFKNLIWDDFILNNLIILGEKIYKEEVSSKYVVFILEQIKNKIDTQTTIINHKLSIENNPEKIKLIINESKQQISDIWNEYNQGNKKLKGKIISNILSINGNISMKILNELL